LTQAALETDPKPVYVSLDAPCRLVDTRPATNIGPKNTPIEGGDAGVYEIQVTGENGQCTAALAIPAGAVGVSLNVTAIAPVAPSGRSYFTVYPADATRPGTSNLNFLSGQAPVPNKVDVGLSAGGAIKIYNNEGTAHAAVDVFGYYIDHDHTGADIVNGSITNIDIADEPGLAWTFETDPMILDPGTVRRVGSASIRVPADGWVVAEAHGIFGATGSDIDEASCQLTKGPVPTGLSIFPNTEPWTSLSDFGSFDDSAAGFSTSRVFDMKAADNPTTLFTGQTIGLDCSRVSGSIFIDDVLVTLTYYPRSYAPITLLPMP